MSIFKSKRSNCSSGTQICPSLAKIWFIMRSYVQMNKLIAQIVSMFRAKSTINLRVPEDVTTPLLTKGDERPRVHIDRKYLIFDRKEALHVRHARADGFLVCTFMFSFSTGTIAIHAARCTRIGLWLNKTRVCVMHHWLLFLEAFSCIIDIYIGVEF